MKLAIALPLLLSGMLGLVNNIHAEEGPVQFTTSEWAPYSHLDHPDQGLFAEVIIAAFKVTGNRAAFSEAPWKRGEFLVETGEAFATFPYVVSEERKKKFDFSAPVVWSAGLVFYVPKNIGHPIVFEKLSDLLPYEFGGVAGSWYEKPFADAKIKVTYTNSGEQNILKLYTDRIDLFLTDELVGWSLIDKLYPGQRATFAVADRMLNYCSLHLMISRRYPRAEQLTHEFNAGLKAIQDSGVYAHILERYGFTHREELSKTATCHF